jgi:GNAT superfamily N-acetyltransferase
VNAPRPAVTISVEERADAADERVVLQGLRAFNEAVIGPPELRGQGLGSRLLAAAEAEAWRRDCLGVFLDTFEYQALPFYQRHGYELFGTLDGYPPGWRQYHVRKLRPSTVP